MEPYSLPSSTRLGEVRLRVRQLPGMLSFYERLLQYRPVSQSASVVDLAPNGQTKSQLKFIVDPSASPRLNRSTGLFHLAILYPSRLQLKRALMRLIGFEQPLQGLANHGVSEAIYLRDPEGNGLELYADLPADQWPRSRGEVAMVTEPLDLENLMAEPEHLAFEEPPSVGHIHLSVAHLEKAKTFYHDLLGFSITQSTSPGALFMAAGDYHHHLAVNTWGGTQAPPQNASGLLSFSLLLPDQAALDQLVARVTQWPWPIQPSREEPGLWELRDPDGITVQLAVGAVEPALAGR